MTTAAVVTAPGALPVLGHLVRLARDPLAVLTSSPAHGDLVEVRVGSERSYPDVSELALIGRVSTTCRRPAPSSDTARVPQPARLHRRHRRPRDGAERAADLRLAGPGEVAGGTNLFISFR